MLNLDICEKCIRKKVLWAKGLDRKSVRKYGEIACPGKHELGPLITKIAGPPPEWCPHKLEHGMSAAMEKNNDEH